MGTKFHFSLPQEKNKEVIKKRALIRTPKRNRVKGGHRKLNNEEFCNVCFSENIIWMIK
jgi:hypothetical protein